MKHDLKRNVNISTSISNFEKIINEITEYDKVLQKEKDFAIQHTKLYYTQRFNRIREMKDKRKPYVEEEIDDIVMKDV